MFETVVPETVAPRSRKLFYEVLPLSLALHALAGGAMVASTIWNVAFPSHSPKLYSAYHLLAAPPPPPPPPPPPLARRVTPAQVAPVKMPLVAPPVIPDTIPDVTHEPPALEVPHLPAEVDSGAQGGMEGGVEGGQIGGTAGSVAPPAPLPPPPEIIHVKRDDPLPVGAISQEYPSYPEYALERNWEDSLVVRYTIGKNGRVTEVVIVTPPQRDEFAREALSTIRHWRFHPYRDENGEPKEVVHELTVNFRIARRASAAR